MATTTTKAWLAPLVIITMFTMSIGVKAQVMNPILGLDIDGIQYDVTFHPNESFADLWGDPGDDTFCTTGNAPICPPTFWGDEEGAIAAAAAIIKALGTEGETFSTVFPTDGFVVPYRYDSENNLVIGTYDLEYDPAIDVLRTNAAAFPYEVISPDYVSYAYFTPSPSPVPAVNLVLLIPGLLLAGAIGLRRLRNPSR